MKMRIMNIMFAKMVTRASASSGCARRSGYVTGQCYR
jgi:hypothetical protein